MSPSKDNTSPRSPGSSGLSGLPSQTAWGDSSPKSSPKSSKSSPKSAPSVRFARPGEKQKKPEFFDLAERIAARKPRGLNSGNKVLGFASARTPVEHFRPETTSKVLRSEALSEVVKGRIVGCPDEEEVDAQAEDEVDLRTRIPVLVSNLELPPFPEADPSFPHFQKTAQSLDRNSAINRARLQGVQSHYERQVEKNPNAFNGLVNLACCFIISHKFREALGLLKKAKTLHPDKANVALNMIICHVQLKQFDAATSIIEESLNYLQGMPQRDRTLLLRFRALCHFRRGIDYASQNDYASWNEEVREKDDAAEEFLTSTKIFKEVARIEPHEGPPRESKQGSQSRFGAIQESDAEKADLIKDLFAIKSNLPQPSRAPPWGRRHNYTDDQVSGETDGGSKLVQARSGWQPLRRAALEELLSQMELQKKNQMDLDLCGNLCSSLYFFKRLEQAQAVVLLEHAKVRLFQAGEYVVKQNDFSDYMYVILMGSVVIDIKLPPVFGEHSVVVNTLYDGQVFGEVSYFASGATRRARREASVIAQEESYLLRADPAVYLEVMKRNVDQDQTHKLAVLCRVPFFDFCLNYQLNALAAHTETLALRLGDCIVYQGQSPAGCYIIAEGHCTLLLSEDADHPVTGFGDPGFTVEPYEDPKIPNAQIDAVNLGTNREGCQRQPRIAIPAQSVPLVCGRLGPGQFLGLGALSDVGGRCAYSSQYTVVVDSSVAKVYTVTRKSLLHLPEASMNGILERVGALDDPINPSQKAVNEAMRAHDRWCANKRRTVFAEMTAGRL